MYRKITSIRFLCAMALFPLTVSAQQFANQAKTIVEPFVVSADSIIAMGKVASIAQLSSSLSNPSHLKLHLVEASKKQLPSTDVYKKASLATVIVGSAYLCPNCSKTHLNNASGYLIAASGVVVTNFHVVKGYINIPDNNKPLGMMVRLANGKTYPVKEVVNASEENDLAVLKLYTGNDVLPFLPLSKGANIGDEAYVLSHPRGMYYFFTKGIVNAKFQEKGSRDKVPYLYDSMVISADYAAGSSGGPVLDNCGNIIGTVSSTRAILYNDPAKSVQMVVKNTIPVESLWKLLN